MDENQELDLELLRAEEEAHFINDQIDAGAAALLNQLYATRDQLEDFIERKTIILQDMGEDIADAKRQLTEVNLQITKEENK